MSTTELVRHRGKPPHRVAPQSYCSTTVPKQKGSPGVLAPAYTSAGAPNTACGVPVPACTSCLGSPEIPAPLPSRHGSPGEEGGWGHQVGGPWPCFLGACSPEALDLHYLHQQDSPFPSLLWRPRQTNDQREQRGPPHAVMLGSCTETRRGNYTKTNLQFLPHSAIFAARV